MDWTECGCGQRVHDDFEYCKDCVDAMIDQCTQEKPKNNGDTLKLIYKKIVGVDIETGFCDDCNRVVKADMYNHRAIPPLMVCADCGQFITTAKEICTEERMCNNCYSGQGKCLNI